jgi:hypothetical protein
MYAPNANMVTSSFDRITGETVLVQTQPYNNFRITNTGGNIIQGQVNKISVTEAMFPYNTPTVPTAQSRALFFTIYDVPVAGPPAALFTSGIVVPLGWYTGTEMVAALNNATILNQAVPMDDYVTFSWDADNQNIYADMTDDWDVVNGGYAVQFFPLVSDSAPISASVNAHAFSYPNLLWTIGFRNFFAQFPLFPLTAPVPIWMNVPIATLISTNTPAPVIAAWPTPVFTRIFGSQYSGRYTDFVDIVSTTLAQAQYIRDSTTAQAAPKRDVIARIFICTNVSTYTADAAGSRPFTIWRNWTNPKILKWTADRSIDAIDLQLFDMYGQPLPNATFGFPYVSPAAPQEVFDCGPSNYGLTFHVHEPSADVQNENVGYHY